MQIHTRISLPCYPYTPASSAPPYTSLLSCYLRSQFALPHVAAIVVLGGTRPLSFLEDPNHFVIWVKRCVKGGRAREREVTVGNTLTRNAVRLFLCGPSPPPAVPTFSPSSCALQGTILRLGSGTFTCSRRAHHRRIHQTRLDQ
ncbi:hypothetical protein BJV77DRAFT_268715 [Russula vinacea]|nr:hypothetical protein BJV77DRAFT_268715 [Russula vinacea]